MNLKKVVLILSASSFLAFSCSVKKEEAAELPDVELDVKGGNMPEYDIDWANVEVSTRERTVKVPKVMVVMEETEVEVPYISITSPGVENGEEKTINVEVEVTGKKRELEIEEVYMANNNLYVISELENEGENLDGKTIRVSDRIIVNVPENETLNVKHYIVGEKPESNFNSGYTFITDKSEISQEIENAKQII